MTAPFTIDHVELLSVERPADVAELSDRIRRCAADNLGVYPVGGGTTLHVGLPPRKPGVAIDMRGLDQVIDYPARDMTITVQAGITIARLQQILGNEQQQLPIDVPAAEKATLGGAIAANLSGPRRYGYGTLRDYVIGIGFVNADGVEVKAGGRVVKNVAGYDLCKLQIGAFGSLGIITQITLKVRPKPESSGLLVLPVSADKLRFLLDRLHPSETRPVCVDVLDPESAAEAYTEMPAGCWMGVIGVEESLDAVRWQRQRLAEIELSAALAGDVRWQEWDAAAPIGKTLTEFPANAAATVSFTAAMLSSTTADFLTEARALCPTVRLQAHAGNGIVHGHIMDTLTLADAGRLLARLRQRACASAGSLVITRCPVSWKRELSLWGEPRGDWELMKAVKRSFDPRDLFNPGRYIV